MCYVDDVVIATPTVEDHIERLEEVFSCMKQAGLKCKPSKCKILKDSIKYLGRLVDKHGVRPDPDEQAKRRCVIKHQAAAAVDLIISGTNPVIWGHWQHK